MAFITELLRAIPNFLNERRILARLHSMPDDVKGEIVKYFDFEDMPMQKLVWGPYESHVREPTWAVEIGGHIQRRERANMNYQTNFYSEYGKLTDIYIRPMFSITDLWDYFALELRLPEYTEREPIELHMRSKGLRELNNIIIYAAVKKFEDQYIYPYKPEYYDFYVVDEFYAFRYRNSFNLDDFAPNPFSDCIKRFIVEGERGRVLFNIAVEEGSIWTIDMHPLIKRY